MCSYFASGVTESESGDLSLGGHTEATKTAETPEGLFMNCWDPQRGDKQEQPGLELPGSLEREVEQKRGKHTWM